MYKIFTNILTFYFKILLYLKYLKNLKEIGTLITLTPYFNRITEKVRNLFLYIKIIQLKIDATTFRRWISLQNHINLINYILLNWLIVFSVTLYVNRNEIYLFDSYIIQCFLSPLYQFSCYMEMELDELFRISKNNHFYWWL